MKYLRVSLNQHSMYLLVLIMSLAISACGTLKVKLVGEYDDIVDKSVHQLESNTNAFITKLSNNIGLDDGSYENNKNFYSEAKGEIKALITRAEFLEDGLKRTPLTDNFKNLVKQYDDLEVLHQTPLSKEVLAKAQEAFDQSFRAIVKHLVFLKWNQKRPKSE